MLLLLLFVVYNRHFSNRQTPSHNIRYGVTHDMSANDDLPIMALIQRGGWASVGDTTAIQYMDRRRNVLRGGKAIAGFNDTRTQVYGPDIMDIVDDLDFTDQEKKQFQNLMTYLFHRLPFSKAEGDRLYELRGVLMGSLLVSLPDIIQTFKDRNESGAENILILHLRTAAAKFFFEFKDLLTWGEKVSIDCMNCLYLTSITHGSMFGSQMRTYKISKMPIVDATNGDRTKALEEVILTLKSSNLQLVSQMETMQNQMAHLISMVSGIVANGAPLPRDVEGVQSNPSTPSNTQQSQERRYVSPPEPAMKRPATVSSPDEPDPKRVRVSSPPTPSATVTEKEAAPLNSFNIMMKSSLVDANRPSFEDYKDVRVYEIIHRIAVHTNVKPASDNALDITGEKNRLSKALTKIKRGLNMIALHCRSKKELDTYVGNGKVAFPWASDAKRLEYISTMSGRVEQRILKWANGPVGRGKCKKDLTIEQLTFGTLIARIDKLPSTAPIKALLLTGSAFTEKRTTTDEEA